jgi:hypothetical protein
VGKPGAEEKDVKYVHGVRGLAEEMKTDKPSPEEAFKEAFKTTRWVEESFTLPDGRVAERVINRNWMDRLWQIRFVKSWDGGFFGIVSWSVAMLAGTLVYDFMARTPPQRASRTLFVWGLALMLVGYAASCLTRLYDLEPVPGLSEITKLEADRDKEIKEVEKQLEEANKKIPADKKDEEKKAEAERLKKEADAKIAAIKADYETKIKKVSTDNEQEARTGGLARHSQMGACQGTNLTAVTRRTSVRRPPVDEPRRPGEGRNRARHQLLDDGQADDQPVVHDLRHRVCHLCLRAVCGSL